jgi:hypothetical protein
MKTFVIVLIWIGIAVSVFVAWLNFLSYVDTSLRENAPPVCETIVRDDGRLVDRPCSRSELRARAKQATGPKNSVASARAVAATGRAK